MPRKARKYTVFRGKKFFEKKQKKLLTLPSNFVNIHIVADESDNKKCLGEVSKWS